ncbi:MAG: Clp protease N-terminal domain-containing protein [Ktedonobacteraceae bacterium]
MFAGAYVRGAKQVEQSASTIQDADDLVPAPASPAEHGNRLTLRVLVHAREEALQDQKEQVGTEYLLLALIREQNGIAFHVLKNLNIEHERIKSAIDFLHTQEHLNEPGVADGFTTDGKHALELALDEAERLGQAMLGTEHLLLGLLRGDGMAAGVLVTRGLNLDNARAETRRLLGF